MADEQKPSQSPDAKSRPVQPWNRWWAARMLAANSYSTVTRDALTSGYLSRDIDMNYECRWPNEITAQNYKALFERNGLANRVVSIWPEECWISPPEVFEVEDAQMETEFEKAWKALESTIHLTTWLKRADILSGIGQFGVIVFGISDGKSFSESVDGIDPVTDEVTAPGKYKLLYLKAFQETDVQIVERESEQSSPRFGLPKMYSVTMENPISGGTSSSKSERVHWSRVLHLADNRLTSDVFGQPRMKPVYNNLLDARKTAGSAGEGYWRAGLSGIAWGLDPALMDPNATIAEDKQEEMQDDLEKFYNSMQRYLFSAGLIPHDIAPKLSDPTPFTILQIKLICIAMGVPERIFMGTEEGKLAGGQDRTGWLERVMGRQKNYLTPMVVLPFIKQLQAYGALPPTQEEPKVDWPDRDSPTEANISDTAVKSTQAMAAYIQGGVNQLMGEQEYLGQVFKKTPDEIKAISDEVNEWEDLNNPPEPVAPAEEQNPKGDGNAPFPAKNVDNKGDEEGYWFTTDTGAKVHVMPGQSKEDAMKERFGDSKGTKVSILIAKEAEDLPDDIIQPLKKTIQGETDRITSKFSSVHEAVVENPLTPPFSVQITPGLLDSENRYGDYSPIEGQIRMDPFAVDEGVGHITLGKFQAVTPTFVNVYDHELGHRFSFSSSSFFDSDGVMSWRNLYESKSKAYWKKNVSVYGATNAEELFAESFSVYMHKDYGKGGVRLPLAVHKFMKKHVK
jgi:hypothetical protein